MKLLTNEELQEDLNNFYVRLQNARDKLASLPKHAENWKQQKKLYEKKRILLAEIVHVERLIHIGEQALTEI